MENTSKDLSKNVVIVPNDATDGDTMFWDTEDHDVATVNNGIVTAVGKGTTNVIVKV